MATMKDMWAQMIEKLTTQAAEIAVLKESKIRALKHAEEKDYLRAFRNP